MIPKTRPTACPKGKCELPVGQILVWCIERCHQLPKPEKKEETGEVTDDDPHPFMNIVPTKLRYFHDRGLAIRGVIHVGLSWGEEIADYLEMGATHVIGVEPLVEAFEEARKLHGQDERVWLWNIGLSNVSAEEAYIRRIDDPDKMAGHPVGTGGSSFLDDLNPVPERCTVTKELAKLWRFDELVTSMKYPPNMADFNALVIDVQGMELDVLKGFGELLKHFDCMNIECSRVPVYEGEAPAQDVIDYLAGFGLKQMTPIEDHNDILFQR